MTEPKLCDEVLEASKIIRKLGGKSKLKYYDWEWCNSDAGILVLIYWNSVSSEVLRELLFIMGKFDLKMRFEGGRHENSKITHQVTLVIDLPMVKE